MNCANHPDRERQAFCQNCGKPLCQACARIVGQAVFCEPCLEERLAAANAATRPGAPGAYTVGSGPTVGSASYQSVPGGGQSYQYVGTAEGTPYSVNSKTPRPGTPNPAIATLLGFIPGVGAMYNGQYAKGIVHLIVFAVLVSLVDHNGIFGLFVAAWIFYQAIEAYHTANARRDGSPLPNPFGLNDVGERFGFGRAWPASTAPTPGAPYAAAAAPAPDWPSPAPPSQESKESKESKEPTNPSPASYVAQPASVPPPSNPYTTAGYAAGPTPWTSAQAYRPAPANAVPAPVPPLQAAASPLPVGAIVLIGLGLLFLLGNAHWLGTLPIHIILPLLLIGLGVWIFVRRMLSYGAGLADDGTPGYQLRVLQALQGSIWITLVGVLFLLDSLHILSWGRSWPLFLIVAGVIFFLQRSASSSLPPISAQTAAPTAAPPPPAPAAPSAAGFPLDLSSPRDAERP